MVGQGCLEIHAWLSQVSEVDYPDLAVFDLDPAEGVSFQEVKQVALIVRGILDRYGITGYPKTSGSSGMHIFIPLKAEYPFSRVTAAGNMTRRIENTGDPYAGIFETRQSIGRLLKQMSPGRLNVSDIDSARL